MRALPRDVAFSDPHRVTVVRDTFFPDYQRYRWQPIEQALIGDDKIHAYGSDSAQRDRGGMWI
jgi:hypothetical protein